MQLHIFGNFTLVNECGAPHSLTNMGLKILLEIIMHRYENRCTMMTSNQPIEEWGKLLSDVPATGAILDRLLHHAEIIPINGRSYRFQPTAKQPPNKK